MGDPLDSFDPLIGIFYHTKVPLDQDAEKKFSVPSPVLSPYGFVTFFFIKSFPENFPKKISGNFSSSNSILISGQVAQLIFTRQPAGPRAMHARGCRRGFPGIFPTPIQF